MKEIFTSPTFLACDFIVSHYIFSVKDKTEQELAVGRAKTGLIA